MHRLLAMLCALCLLAGAQETEPGREAAAAATIKPMTLRTRIRKGQRFTGSNVVSYEVTTMVREGNNETTSIEAVQRTERFLDEVVRSSSRLLEIDRSYLRLFTKARSEKHGRPNVYQNPVQGRTVRLRERNRRRDVHMKGGEVIDPLVRKTAGLEIDWRDILPEDPVAPGDTWSADATSLGRRLAAYLNAGARSRMQVRFEEIFERDGARLAKLYVDWRVEGMRDKHLFTKVTLAGDVYFDLQLKRFVEVDLTGNMTVRGAIIGQGQPRIVKGEGPVSLKSTLKAAPVEASAGGEGR